MTLVFRQLARSDSAFAAAIAYLAPRAPFDAMPFGPIADTVSGAIKRGHYILAIENGRVVGFTCWAVTDAKVAEQWMAGELRPTYQQTLGGDTVVLTLGGGEHPRVALLGIRHIAGLYPGMPYWMNRVGRDARKRGRFPPQRMAVSASGPAGS